MFQLSPATELYRALPKTALYEKFNLVGARQRQFEADVSKMILDHRIDAETIPAVQCGKEVESIWVLAVTLKHRNYNPKNIIMLQKMIPQNIVFALQYDGQTQLCIFHTRLQQSAWRPTEETIIPLQGLNIDDVWNNIVACIGDLDASSEETIEQQILNREQKEKLLRQIEVLENKCRLEKQTHKKYELHQEIVKLKTLI